MHTPLQTRSILLLLCLVAALAPTALGKNQPRIDNDERPRQFQKGDWSFQTYGGYWNELGSGDQEAVFGTVGVGYYFVDNMSLNAEFTGMGVWQPGDDAVAGELHLLLRHHLFKNDRWSFFLDVGMGVFEADEEMPAGGTRFNFTTQTGPGLTYRLSDNLNLMIGGRFLHLSNAQIEGAVHNPSINAAVGYVGLIYTF